MNKTVTINGAPGQYGWHREPVAMQRGMGELEIEITTTWQVGSPFIIRGAMYKKPFENTGTVLAFQPYQLLSYSHLGSLSLLAHKPESYTIFEFKLAIINEQTALTFTASNFATDTIYSYLAFYWNVALALLKRYVEAKVN